MNNEELWQATLGELELSLSRANFTTWFKNTFIAECGEHSIVIGVPNTFTKVWLEKKYHGAILKTLNSIAGSRVTEVIYKVDVRKGAPINTFFLKKELEGDLQPEEPHYDASLETEGGLNKRYVFETFVVGKGNELAFAAFQAAAKDPGRVYNPLFLYGGVGLGKTHLLQALGRAVKEKNPKARVLYVTTEQFTNDYIQAVRNGQAKEFKDNYRNIDVLLIDDIQFISGKEGTQEEFFHTFNALHQANKQIAITSDRPPKSISALEHRLQSRFVWGMTVDISQPDIETRMAILESKCREKNYELTGDIIQFIAASIQNNVRELEGALNKIIAHHQFNNVKPDLSVVRSILSSFSQKPVSTPLTPKRFVTVVADFFSISIDDLTGKRRHKTLVVPRQITMYLMRSMGGLSFPGIGNELGGRDHTTAMHACEKIERELTNNETLRQNVELLKQKLFQST